MITKLEIFLPGICVPFVQLSYCRLQRYRQETSGTFELYSAIDCAIRDVDSRR